MSKTIHIHLPLKKRVADRVVKAKDASSEELKKRAEAVYKSALARASSPAERMEAKENYEYMMKQLGETADAGFDRREYSPREYNRLTSEIKEVEARIKELKAKKTPPPLQIKNEELVLEKLKKERDRYRTDDSKTKDMQVDAEDIGRTAHLKDSTSGKIIQVDEAAQKVKIEFYHPREGKFSKWVPMSMITSI